MTASSDPASTDLGVPVGNARLSEQVYERLKAGISGGVLKPGERLDEQDIAHRLSVSQSPVREALLRLTREHMVIQMPRHVYQVRILPEAGERFGRGEKVALIAGDLRVSECSVERWRRAWREGGMSALESSGRVEAPRRRSGFTSSLRTRSGS